MPVSDRPETGADAPSDADGADHGEGRPDPEAQLEALEDAVGRLVEVYRELKERADRAEAAEESLARALSGAELDDMGSQEVADRLQELAEENRRLREVILEGRERAARIRSRLILMEDEA